MAFEDDILKLTMALRDQASTDVQRATELRTIQAEETAARFGLGGVSASRLTGVQREGAESLVGALRQADIFGASQSAGEASRVSAFDRDAGLQKELQDKRLSFAREELQSRADAASANRGAGIFGGIFGGLAGIAGTVLGQKFNPLNSLTGLTESRQELLKSISAGGSFTPTPNLASNIG